MDAGMVAVRVRSPRVRLLSRSPREGQQPSGERRMSGRRLVELAASRPFLRALAERHVTAFCFRGER